MSGDTKDVARQGTALIATLASLVFGLLIASANGKFETESGQIKQLTASVVLLDNALGLYGPEAEPARAQLRRQVGAAASISLFAEGNARTITILCIFVSSRSQPRRFSSSLELGQPFAGLMQISDEPLRHALSALPKYRGTPKHRTARLFRLPHLQPGPY